MASVAVTVSTVRRINGIVYVRWSDGVENQFDSLADAKTFIQDGDAFRDIARRMLIARYLRVDPTGNNPGLIEGRTMTLTDENNTMAVVSNG